MRRRRKKYLIQPRLQLLFGLVFLSTSGLYVLLQAILLNWNMTRLSGNVPAGGEVVLDHLLSSLRTNLAVTFALMVPLTLAIGVFVTHRVVGPIYRFERFLREVVAGERPKDIRIRKDDELQELCRLLNEATLPLRARPGEDDAGAELDSVPSLVAEPAAEEPTRSV